MTNRSYSLPLIVEYIFPWKHVNHPVLFLYMYHIFDSHLKWPRSWILSLSLNNFLNIFLTMLNTLEINISFLYKSITYLNMNTLMVFL